MSEGRVLLPRGKRERIRPENCVFISQLSLKTYSESLLGVQRVLVEVYGRDGSEDGSSYPQIEGRAGGSGEEGGVLSRLIDKSFSVNGLMVYWMWSCSRLSFSVTLEGTPAPYSVTRNQLNVMGYSAKLCHFCWLFAVPIKTPTNLPHVHCAIKGMGVPEPLHVS